MLSSDHWDVGQEIDPEISKKLNTLDVLISTYINHCLSGPITPLKLFLQNMEKEIIKKVLYLTKWNQKLTSQVLQVNEKTLSVK